MENCSLMLQQGNLQAFKKGIGNDRGDTFIWASNDYFIGNSELVLNRASQENIDTLKKFLKRLLQVNHTKKKKYIVIVKYFIILMMKNL